MDLFKTDIKTSNDYKLKYYSKQIKRCRRANKITDLQTFRRLKKNLTDTMYNEKYNPSFIQILLGK